MVGRRRNQHCVRGPQYQEQVTEATGVSVRKADGDAFLFGPETRGLPQDVLDAVAPELQLRLPMRPGNRSLNLSNAVAVVVFEAWRQNGFAGAG